jgi:hypothetical protein
MSIAFIVKKSNNPSYWDPTKIVDGVVLSQENSVATFTANNFNYRRVYGDVGQSSGKRYFEIQSSNVNGSFKDIGIDGGSGNYNDRLGQTVDGWSYPANSVQTIIHNNSGKTTFNTVDWRDGTYVLMCAVDFNTGNCWFGHDGTWIVNVEYPAISVPDPATGAFPNFHSGDNTEVSGLVYPACCMGYSGDVMTSKFNLSEFTYPVPSGFVAWSA